MGIEQKKTISSFSMGSKSMAVKRPASSIGGASSSGGGSGDFFGKLGRDGKDTSLSQKQLEDSIFSVLYVMRGKSEQHRRVVILSLLIDFAQLLAFPLDQRFNWVWPPGASNLISVFASIVPYNFLEYSPYSVFAYVFAATTLLVVLSFADAIWVLNNFRKNHFPFMWPIKVLKVVVALFFKSLYLSTISILLRALDCNYSSPAPFVLRQFPTYGCWGFPNGLLAVVAVLATAGVIAFAIALAMIENEPNPATESLEATASSTAAVESVIGRAFLALSAVLLQSYPFMLALVNGLINTFIGYRIYHFLPFYNLRMNCARVAMQAVVSWACFCAFALTFLPGVALAITVAFGVGVPAVAAAFWLLTLRRFSRMCNARLVGVDVAGQAAYFGRLESPEHVEIAARFVRNARDPKTDQIDEELVDRAEAVYQHGIKEYPRSALVYLAFSNFVRVFRDNAQLEFTYVDRSRHLPLSFPLRYALFCKDREKDAKSSAAGGEGGMDLVSFVEFQKQLKSAKEGHIKCLKCIKTFWTLLQDDAEGATNRLSDVLRLIDMYEARAEKNYTALLSKYPSSIKILRAYGGFVEQVKNDPYKADEYFRMADQEEEEQSRLNTEGGGPGGIEDARKSVVVITADEVIVSVNAMTCQLFGYKKHELVGKRIHTLVPSPFREEHTSYVKNYLRTGIAKVVNTSRDLYGQKKDGTVMPIKLYVTRMDVGEQTTFVGAITPVEQADPVAIVNAAGRLTARPGFRSLLEHIALVSSSYIVHSPCNEGAARLFEMSPEELAKRDIRDLFPPRYWAHFDPESRRPPLAMARLARAGGVGTGGEMTTRNRAAGLALPSPGAPRNGAALGISSTGSLASDGGFGDNVRERASAAPR
eukprot:tig00021522_g22101.t1